jgi:DNA-binding MarR family transcriptional regulator
MNGGRAAPKRRAKGAPKSGLDMGLLPDLLGYHLRCAHVSVFQHFGRTVGQADISPPQLGTLLLIEANPGMSQSAIAEALRFDRSTLVQIIDRLEERGLVKRESSARDRRSHALALTPAGSKLLIKLKEMLRAHEDEIASGLDAEERAALIRLLERLHSRG